MTVRELCSLAAQQGALDYEVFMNCNLEPFPVSQILIVPDIQVGDKVYKRIVVLDN